MKDTRLNVGFITTLSGRWPRELPEKRMKEYGNWLEKNLSDVNLIQATQLGCDMQSVTQITKQFRENGVDLIVLVYGAFTGDDVCTCLTQALNVPIVLWAPREPAFNKEDRLYANALVAMTMNAASLFRLDMPYHAVYGNYDEEYTAQKIIELIEAYRVIKIMRQTTLGLFGYRPTAFYNCAFDEGLIRRIFGIRIEETDLKVIFDQMQTLDPQKVAQDIEQINTHYNPISLPDDHLENHSRLYFALKKVFKEQGYDYGVLKCWPEMGNLHATPCAVLGRLSDDAINIGCEGDVDAELTQIVQNLFTGQPTFIADMINIENDDNTLTYWHCGNAAPSLHNKKYDRLLQNHPLAGQGTAFYASLKPGPVTVARFCNIHGMYKLFMLTGEAVDADWYTRGSMVKVKVKTPVMEIINRTIEYGVPHHYSIVWEDIEAKMVTLCQLLGIEVIRL